MTIEATELVNVKVEVIDSQGSPVGTRKMQIEIQKAKSKCRYQINGHCVTANSSSPCNLTSEGCRNNNPKIIEIL